MSDDIRITMPRPMAEALEKTLRHLPTGYNERGTLASKFYDLLEAALAGTAGGCQGCEKAAALELENKRLEERLARFTNGEAHL